MSPLRLKNPLQSRSSFSDTDVRNLVPLPKERHRLRHHYEWDAAYVSKGDMLDEIPYRPSISDRITKSGILCDAKNKREVSAIMSIIFIEIFYQALRKHFVCPICNEFLHKPCLLPSCGHTFCSHCLAYWFRQNSRTRSCPICRKFTPQSQKPVRIPAVNGFIKSVEKLWNYFYHAQHHHDSPTSPPTKSQTNADPGTYEILRVLRLPETDRNANVLKDLLPQSASQFSSPSLAAIQKKWAFMQLLHNLRFAQLQISNRSDIERPSPFGWIGKYKVICLEILKMTVPGYTTICRAFHIIKSMASGRGRLLMRIPSSEQTCLILIGVLLMCFICTLFQFVMQRGLKAQVKLTLHFASVLVFNDIIDAQ